MLLSLDNLKRNWQNLLHSCWKFLLNFFFFFSTFCIVTCYPYSLLLLELLMLILSCWIVSWSEKCGFLLCSLVLGGGCNFAEDHREKSFHAECVVVRMSRTLWLRMDEKKNWIQALENEVSDWVFGYVRELEWDLFTSFWVCQTDQEKRERERLHVCVCVCEIEHLWCVCVRVYVCALFNFVRCLFTMSGAFFYCCAFYLRNDTLLHSVICLKCHVMWFLSLISWNKILSLQRAAFCVLPFALRFWSENAGWPAVQLGSVGSFGNVFGHGLRLNKTFVCVCPLPYKHEREGHWFQLTHAHSQWFMSAWDFSRARVCWVGEDPSSLSIRLCNNAWVHSCKHSCLLSAPAASVIKLPTFASAMILYIPRPETPLLCVCCEFVIFCATFPNFFVTFAFVIYVSQLACARHWMNRLFCEGRFFLSVVVFEKQQQKKNTFKGYETGLAFSWT